jgi:hypothetical protein
MNEYGMSWSDVRSLFTKSFPAMRYLKILEDRTTGTLTQTTWEMLIEIEYSMDEPQMGLKAGVKTWIRGTAIQTWRWEGTDMWDGSSTDEAISQWKIVQENDYMCVLPADSQGSQLKIFGAPSSDLR